MLSLDDFRINAKSEESEHFKNISINLANIESLKSDFDKLKKL